MFPRRKIHGAAAKAIREARGLTSAEVADAMEVSRPFYYRLENDLRTSSKPETAEALARALKVSVEQVTIPVSTPQTTAAVLARALRSAVHEDAAA